MIKQLWANTRVAYSPIFSFVPSAMPRADQSGSAAPEPTALISSGDLSGISASGSSCFSRARPSDSMARQKVAWAKELLRGSGKSVAEISDELGFLDSSYFIRVFKSVDGITPHAFRQQKYYS